MRFKRPRVRYSETPEPITPYQAAGQVWDIDAGDRASVEDEMIKLLNPASATRLSAAGDKLLDLYAAYGVRLILDKMLPPSTVEDFLVGYKTFWVSSPTG